MVTKKKPATRWYDGTTPIEDLAANEQLAHEMVSRHRDLARPSSGSWQPI